MGEEYFSVLFESEVEGRIEKLTKFQKEKFDFYLQAFDRRRALMLAESWPRNVGAKNEWANNHF